MEVDNIDTTHSVSVSCYNLSMSRRKYFYQNVVYMATNLTNGKRYIGGTTRGLLNRKQQHAYDAKKGKGCALFSKAVRKYGIDGFSWEILEECATPGELWRCEADYVLRFKPEYNVIIGEDETAWALRRMANTAVSRPVVCLNDGKRYASGMAACRAYNLSQMTVSKICNKGGETIGGLRFMFADASEPVIRQPKTQDQIQEHKAAVRRGLLRAQDANKKAVVCIDTGANFKSISDAAAANGLSISEVSSAIKRNGRAKGIRFRFLNDPERPADTWRYQRRRTGKNLKGAHKRSNGKWSSTIFVGGRLVHLGTYNTEVEAHNAYMAAVANVIGVLA